MSKSVVVIGGSGFANKLQGKPESIRTPFGTVSVLASKINSKTVYSIKRHGAGHEVPPHMVNYKANIWVAKEIQGNAIFASSATGVINPKKYSPGDLILCSDLLALNLTLGGQPITYFHDFSNGIHHVDTSHLFDRELNNILLKIAAEHNVTLKEGAIITTTMGPRYESPAEIEALKRLGADLVGMTTAYEAILARELGIPYTVIAIGTNWAAGIGDKPLSHDEVTEMMAKRAEDVSKVLIKAIERL